MLNPLGMAEALIGAIDHAADLAGGDKAITEYTVALRQAIHTLMVFAFGFPARRTGRSVARAEQFVDARAAKDPTWRLRRGRRAGAARGRDDLRVRWKRRSSPSTTSVVDGDAVNAPRGARDATARSTLASSRCANTQPGRRAGRATFDEGARRLRPSV